MKTKNKIMQKAKKIVLGEGEIIGHKHILESKKELEYEQKNDSITFMLADMGILTHDEHDKMVFPKGKYRSYNQVEFNPFDNTVQRVFD
jgi:glutaminase